MPNIQDIITAREVGAYWIENQQYEEPYFGESKFPNRKKLGLDLSWIMGANKAPVALSLSAFDADVIPLVRGTVEKQSTNMPFFKNSYRIDEKLRQELNMVAESNPTALNVLLGRVFDDAGNLMRNASLTREMLRMQLLTTGVISLSDNGQAYTYDYNIPVTHKVSPTNKWNVPASADPIGDIEAWQEVIAEETGTKPTEILMNSKTLSYIGKADAIRNGIFLNASVSTTPTARQVQQFVSDQLGITIFVYDKGYSKNGVFTKFIPDGTVVLMPEQDLGSTWFGTTPEESDLMSGSNAQVSIVDTGVAITTWKVADPVTVETKASMICLPSFELANQVIIASVL